MSGKFDLTDAEGGLFGALVEAARRFGASKPALEDQERVVLTYRDVIRASFALGRKLAALSRPGEHVGVLLPSSSAAVVTFFGLLAFGRIPTMLNFSAGNRNLRAATTLANVSRVLTSRRFIEQGKLHDQIDALSERCEISYLEDLRKTIGTSDRLFALAAGMAPSRFAHRPRAKDTAVILFTSGSFGAPRGVLLSHGNLVANARQVAAHIALDPKWVFFNPLPVFHCFGLTGGVVLPLLNGMKAFQYPSPLHVKIIPQLVEEVGASVLFATDTFLNQYARACEGRELAGLQFIVCGAEKVRDETHAMIAERFGPVPLLEGYGATEASPVVAVNKPNDNRKGTVGGLLPGMETRLEPVDGIPKGGRLYVRGPNVMLGYLQPDGSIEAPPDGWHDTGDVVEIAVDGWVKILGRVKRFAKIGGEMVSLTAVEDLASSLWPHARHAAISEPDPKKGERLVLITDEQHAKTAALLAHAKEAGAPEIAVPRKIIVTGEIPVLGSGKTDYAGLARLAEAGE